MTLIRQTQAVSHASWVPVYEVRVNSTDPSSPATVAYKASIGQETGEVCMFSLLYTSGTDTE